LFGQGIVLADTKTARPALRVFVPSSTVVAALNAFGLFARTEPIPIASITSIHYQRQRLQQ
jgi:hypothetical protein